MVVEIEGEVIRRGGIKEYDYGKGVVKKFFIQIKDGSGKEYKCMVEVDGIEDERLKVMVGDWVRVESREVSDGVWLSCTKKRKFEIVKKASGIDALFDDKSDESVVSVSQETTIDYKKEEENTKNTKDYDRIGEFIDYYGIRKIFDTCNKILLVGPRGCGKSFAVEQYAKVMGKKVVTVSCDYETEKYDLLGRWVLKGKKMEWVDGVVVKALREGWWLVFDEINMARPEVLAVLNSLLDFRGRLILKEKDGEEIVISENVKIFATMNEGYQGTMVLNEAFLDRFQAVIDLTYLPWELEKEIIGVKKEIEDKVKMFVGKVRKAMESGEILSSVSTRALMQWMELYVVVGCRKAFEVAVLGKIRDDVERRAVDELYKMVFGVRE